jgi:antitoxin component of MazEF toxin-antitoxin module
MVTAKLRRSGNSFIVTVPRKEVDRLRLHEGQTVAVEVHAVEVRPVVAADLQGIVAELLTEHAEALRYLAEH